MPGFYSNIKWNILVNTNFWKDEISILKLRLKIAMFLIKLTDISAEKVGQQDISPQLMPPV